MPRSAPFQQHHRRYDDWFEHHAAAYYSELLAVRALLPWHGRGLSIGVGTRRFAAPLGVRLGIDPARAMLSYAARRGVIVVQGVAETLPFADASFDYILSVTTICFVEDARAMMAEAHRVLKRDGKLVIGFIDRGSTLGREYLEHQNKNAFYREASFFSVDEVEQLLFATGFNKMLWVQTLVGCLSEVYAIEPLREGHGEAAFVVVRASCF
ncbi:class I SAM-dependent methyltransferase [Desulfoferula mesophila]|uniref:Type 11 methyltransferase n=1 Tax=Desulfoferula mesophila TaxID=3058419 RepID=A0AAU9EMF0_9BACT|nr:type 11 methyltransferase [Desulfoferula mesophilus]